MIRSRHRQDLLAVSIMVFLIGGVLLGMIKFPEIWLTLLLGVMGFVSVLVRPIWGIIVVLALVYFTIFPNVSLGPVEISASTIPVIGLAVASAFKLRSSKLAGWQAGLTIFLGLAFIVTTLTSTSITTSLRLLPNLLMYVLIIFSTAVLLDNKKDLVLVSRSMLVLTFMNIVWSGLYPLRTVLNIPIPNPGLNGLIFQFHPALGLGLTALFLPVAGISGRWRGFSILLFVSIILLAVVYQTRSFWISTLVVTALFLLLVRPRVSGLSVLIILLLMLMVSTQYMISIQNNFEQSRTSLLVFLGIEDEKNITSDDLIRLLAFDAGKRMFFDSPVFGQGPNVFSILKPRYSEGLTRFVTGPTAGAFNSWMMVLSEMGLLGFVGVLLAFLSPLLILVRQFARDRSLAEDENVTLALGLALGVLSMGIHLLFIDLMYGTFVWINVGINLSAASLVLKNSRRKSVDANQFRG